MKEHILEAQMELPLKLTEVFPFLCNMLNLEKIAPPGLRFKITTPQPMEIHLGTVVDCRFQLYAIRFRWQSQITVWRPPYEFEDRQINGPYRLWIHRHQFYEQNGITIIQDTVHYQLPLWPLLEAIHPLLRIQLKRIFEYRYQATRDALLGKES